MEATITPNDSVVTKQAPATEDPIVKAVRKYLDNMEPAEKLAYAMGLVMLGANGSCNSPVPMGLDDLANEYRHKFCEEIESQTAKYISGDEGGVTGEHDIFENQSEYQIAAVMVTMVNNFR